VPRIRGKNRFRRPGKNALKSVLGKNHRNGCDLDEIQKADDKKYFIEILGGPFNYVF
jgi:hypothetical protein